MSKRFQVVGIGNAVVDVISRCEDAVLSELGIEKGIMQLVEKDRSAALFAAMDDRVETPGGSVANTLAGLGNLGLSTGFIGRVADDDLGKGYARGMAADGTVFTNAPVKGADLPTSRSMIFVSPDGERSMNTYLGISSEIDEGDVHVEVARDAEVMFLEGYLYDKDKGKAAFDRAAKLTHEAGGKVGISLSDPFCVERHREDFRRFVREMDFVIGNEHEWEALYQTDLSAALERAAGECGLVVCTRGGSEVILVRGEEEAVVPVTEVKPVDTTGAGDQFAAGFLYGYALGRDLADCGRMGVLAAGEVIGHIGPRPEADLKALFKDAGLL